MLHTAQCPFTAISGKLGVDAQVRQQSILGLTWGGTNFSLVYSRNNLIYRTKISKLISLGVVVANIQPVLVFARRRCTPMQNTAPQLTAAEVRVYDDSLQKHGRLCWRLTSDQQHMQSVACELAVRGG